VSERRAVVFAVVLTAVFVVVRAHVYYDWPVANAADWNRRDAFMTWPRLAAGAACLAAMAAWGGLRRWGVRRNATAAGLALLAAAGAGILVVSSDHEEILGLCSRIGIFRQGRLMEVVANVGLTPPALLARCFG